MVYGINQGVGEPLIFTAQKYYLVDSLHVSPAAYGQINGFTKIPWQIKALWGLLSDTVPINGYHRRPYILFAGSIGVVAVLLLAMSSGIDVTVVLDDSELNLGMRQADVAIRMSPPRQPDLIQRHLMTTRYHVYASKEYLEAHGTPETIQDLDHHQLIAYGDDATPPEAIKVASTTVSSELASIEAIIALRR